MREEEPVPHDHWKWSKSSGFIAELPHLGSQHLTGPQNQREFAFDVVVHCLTTVLSPTRLAWKSSIFFNRKLVGQPIFSYGLKNDTCPGGRNGQMLLKGHTVSSIRKFYKCLLWHSNNSNNKKNA